MVVQVEKVEQHLKGDVQNMEELEVVDITLHQLHHMMVEVLYMEQVVEVLEDQLIRVMVLFKDPLEDVQVLIQLEVVVLEGQLVHLLQPELQDQMAIVKYVEQEVEEVVVEVIQLVLVLEQLVVLVEILAVEVVEVVEELMLQVDQGELVDVEK